jgi:hypothetical protein
MQVLKTRTHIDKDGVLRLELPAGIYDKDVEVVLVLNVRTKMTQEEWRAFIDETAGSLADDPIERGDQGIIQIRNEQV